MPRDYGTRTGKRMEPRGLPPFGNPEQRDERDVHGELSELRTALRNLGLLGLRVFDIVISRTDDEDDAEWINDNVKPVLDHLAHLKE